jgi:hypothetical protein
MELREYQTFCMPIHDKQKVAEVQVEHLYGHAFRYIIQILFFYIERKKN